MSGLTKGRGHSRPMSWRLVLALSVLVGAGIGFSYEGWRLALNANPVIDDQGSVEQPMQYQITTPVPNGHGGEMVIGSGAPGIVTLVDPNPQSGPALELKLAVDAAPADQRQTVLWDKYCSSRLALFNLAPEPAWGVVGDGNDIDEQLIDLDLMLQREAVFLFTITNTQIDWMTVENVFYAMESEECLARQ